MKLKIATLLTLLFLPVICAASANNLKITEIMYDLAGADSGLEWVEICNIGSLDILILTDKNGWRFVDTDGNHILNPPSRSDAVLLQNECAVLAADANSFLTAHSNFNGTLIDTVMSLRNTSSTLQILDESKIILDEVTYSSAWGGAGTGYSLEKISPVGANTADNWKESAILNGTPGYIQINNETIEQSGNETQNQTESSSDISQNEPAPQQESLPPATESVPAETSAETQEPQPVQTDSINSLQADSAPTPVESPQETTNQTLTNETTQTNENLTPANSESAQENTTSPTDKTNLPISHSEGASATEESQNNNKNQNLTASIQGVIENPSKNSEQTSSAQTSSSEYNFKIYLLAIAVAVVLSIGIIYLSKMLSV